MAETHLNESFRICLDVSSVAALDDAVVPIVIGSADGKVLLANRAARRAANFTAAERPDLAAWVDRMCPDLGFSQTEPIDWFNLVENRTVSGTVSADRAGAQDTRAQMVILPGTIDTNQEAALLFAFGSSECCSRKRRIETARSELEDELSGKETDLRRSVKSLQKEMAEKERMSEALTHSRERLKKMSRHALDILEADRRTISRELHDSIGANLAAIKFSLEEKEVSRTGNKNRLEQSLDWEIGHLAETIKETKRISAHLRPTILDDLGLRTTIEWYVRQFQRLYGDISIQCAYDISEEDVPEEIKINMYRIIQEGLRNAERHGNASHIWLSMEFCDGNRSVSLVIEDDGQGFDISGRRQLDNDPMSGYGLTAMRERCEIFGGSFHLDSKPGKGTRIKAILPIGFADERPRATSHEMGG